LDEIAELSMALQGKLLRMAQDHEIIPVGSTKPIKINARIIAATNKDLETLVREGRFREDLFFRLNVICIEAPPLRHRRDDVTPLAYFFLEKFKKRFQKMDLILDKKVLASLQAYDWPGNVRELENLMQYLVAVSDGAGVKPESLPEKIRRVSVINGDNDNVFPEADFATAKKRYLDNFTRTYLISNLRRNEGNVSGTAKQINVCRSSLQRMIKRFGITKTDLA
jgi:transcriptional regulator with PAS, ATPase and Fis domain